MYRFFLLFCLISSDSYAQQLVSGVSRHQIFIGEPIEYIVEWRGSEQDHTVLYTDGIREHMSILSKKHLSEKTANGKVKRQYVFSITSYESGDFLIPALPLLVNSRQMLYTKTARIQVREPVVDAFKEPLYEIKDILHEKRSWWERLLKYWPYLLIFTLSFLSGALIIFLFLRERRRKHSAKSITADTPYQEALKALQAISLDEKRPQACYQGLMRIFKTYLHREFHYDAFRAFPLQIIRYLRSKQIAEPKELESIREFFKRADRAKFGRGKPSFDQLEQSRERVRNFVQAAHDLKESIERKKNSQNA